MLRLFILTLLFTLISAEACAPEGPKEKGCPIEGNGDFYGLGVRMGIYSAWLTSWFANNFLPEEIIGSLETNSIFLLALFATVFFYSVQENGIRVVDVLVIHQLCLGFLFSVMSLWGYRTMYYRTEGPGGRRHFGGFGTHFRLVLMGMITAYGVWFWIEGVEDGLSECDRRRNCGGLQTFFIVPVKVDSWANKSIQLVINIGAASYYGIMALAALAGGTAYTVRRIRGKEVHWELIKEHDSTVNLTKRELTKWYITLSCFNLIWIVFAMISIEFTLNLNHMNNVIGTLGLVGPGQLIPLAIGLLSLARVQYILARQHIPWLRKKEDTDNGVSGSGSTYQVDPDSPSADQKFMGGIGLTMTNINSIYSPAPYSPETPLTMINLSSSPGHPTKSSTSTISFSPEQAPSVARGSISTLPPLPAIAAAHRCSLPHRILLAWLPWLGVFEWSKRSLTPSLGHYTAFAGHTTRHSPSKFSPSELFFPRSKIESTRTPNDKNADADAEAGRVMSDRTNARDNEQEPDETQQSPSSNPKQSFGRTGTGRIKPGSLFGHTTMPSIKRATQTQTEKDSPSTGLLRPLSQPRLAAGQKGLMSPVTDMDIELQAQRRSRQTDDTTIHSTKGIYEGGGYDDDDDDEYD